MKTYNQWEREVRYYKDMLTLKRMMSAYSADFKDYNRVKDSMTDSAISGIRQRLTNLRVMARSKVDPLQSPRSLAKREAAIIVDKLGTLSYNRKFEISPTVTKNPPSSQFERPWKTGAQPTVRLNVGHMWFRSVWKNFYEKGGFIPADNLIILQAVEYRSNVPHTRVYSAVCYSVTDKQTIMGWIGQSILDSRSTFRSDQYSALQAAKQLTVKSVTKQIQGEM